MDRDTLASLVVWSERLSATTQRLILMASASRLETAGAYLLHADNAVACVARHTLAGVPPAVDLNALVADLRKRRDAANALLHEQLSSTKAPPPSHIDAVLVERACADATALVDEFDAMVAE